MRVRDGVGKFNKEWGETKQKNIYIKPGPASSDGRAFAL